MKATITNLGKNPINKDEFIAIAEAYLAWRAAQKEIRNDEVKPA